MLENHGFRLLKEKGSVRYYRKPAHGTCRAILKAAGIKPGGNDD